uniref:Uncharacterized protein n=1 Tax=uncultured bacterium contig00048 TaxID=1181533 RepID=A0A806K2L8_9BACT|nr:hypothetical protein [uncultured bacterium contig00048]
MSLQKKHNFLFFVFFVKFFVKYKIPLASFVNIVYNDFKGVNETYKYWQA